MATLTKKTLDTAKLQTIFDGLTNDALDTAKRAAEVILDRALPMTPMHSGALRESGRIEVRGDAKDIEVAVIFGNDTTIDYAAIVHEDLAEKEFTEPGTGPKYLENAVDQSMNEIDDMFSNTVEMSFKNRGKA